ALLPPSPDLGQPRLWVDRSFTIAGAGTVVTGTLTGGTLRVGDALSVYPSEATVRVRALQTHERTVTEVAPGNRTAVNLGGVDRAAVWRGTMLGLPGAWRTTARLIADLRTVRSLGEPLSGRGSFHAHIGSGSHTARVQLLEGPELVGHGAALITLETPVPVAAGDRIVLREVGRRAVVAGGQVLDPHPEERVRPDASRLGALRAATTPNDRAAVLLSIRGIARTTDLAADTAGGVAIDGLAAGDLTIDATEIGRLEAEAIVLLARYHDENPLRPGMPAPALATALRVPIEVLEVVVAKSPQLDMAGPAVRRAGFSPRLEGTGSRAWDSARALLDESGFAAPRRDELGLEPEVLHALLRDGALVAVGDDLVYLPETLDRIVGAARDMQDGFSVAGFRDALGITRRHAVPLLEWMDRAGITRREGDVRSVRR
ncbi:MAG TPA: SelB C-terminal domain-containing protein, partial [Acidimicrobiia bacterium]|nr:SelB C-terminal domain-containing protein [Acidimicrobiia bacterium]